MTNHGEPAGAERHAQRDLATAIERPRHEQITDVHARNQQHGTDDCEQQKQRRSRPSDEALVQRHRSRAAVTLSIGKRRAETACNHIEIGCHAGEPRAWLHPRDTEEPEAREIVAFGKGAGRNEHIAGDRASAARDCVGVEGRRKDANDGKRRSVQRELLPQDGIGAAEAALPERMRDDDEGLRLPGRALVLGEEAAPLRRHPQHVEERARDEVAGHSLRLSVARQVHALREPEPDAFNRLRLFANGQVFAV